MEQVHYTRYSGIFPHNNHTISNTALIYQQQTRVSEVETRAILETIPAGYYHPVPNSPLALLASGLYS